MKIYKLLTPGKYHKVHGEDFLYHQFLGSKWLVAAVMDGCSSGKESHFASTLYAKSLHKSCRMLPNMKEILPEFDIGEMEQEDIAKFILVQLFEDVKKIKKTLFLDIEEILSTLTLMVFNLEDNSAFINMSGDGFIVCNSIVKEVDHRNIPDYLGYHLDLKFDKWYEGHTLSLQYEDVKDISISTDGIEKLRANSLKKQEYSNAIDLFLIDQPKGDPERAFIDLYTKLIEEGFIPHDDIGIIRIIL
jgi:hypothetical protein